MPCPNIDRKSFVCGASRLLPWPALMAPALAQAHAFGRAYNLPVPLWLYQYGAGAALMASFIVMAAVVSRDQLGWIQARRELPDALVRPFQHSGWTALLRTASVAMLGLAIASGLFGHPNPYLNLSMTAFWVVFVLGFFYLQALLGDHYAWLNPWQNLCAGLERLLPALFRPRLRNPERSGYLPALILYLAFIWQELYGAGRPVETAQLLIAYTLINLVGAALWGIPGWFRYGEFFAVIFRLAALIAPVARENGKLYLRWPFVGLLQVRCEGITQLLLILFMLSSTAFDGLQATLPWLMQAWALLRALLAAQLAVDPAGAVALLQSAMQVLKSLSLLASPFLYLLAYWLVIALARRICGSAGSLRDWLLCFGLSLVPIAFAYHIAHYYTLLQVQGIKLLPLLSDPFGQGTNWLGTARWFVRPVIPDAGVVWHVQTGMILAGHVAGVFVAHAAALQDANQQQVSTRRLVCGQIPMLLLMVALTASGLWILAQPLQPG